MMIWIDLKCKFLKRGITFTLSKYKISLTPPKCWESSKFGKVAMGCSESGNVLSFLFCCIWKDCQSGGRGSFRGAVWMTRSGQGRGRPTARNQSKKGHRQHTTKEGGGPLEPQDLCSNPALPYTGTRSQATYLNLPNLRFLIFWMKDNVRVHWDCKGIKHFCNAVTL